MFQALLFSFWQFNNSLLIIIIGHGWSLDDEIRMNSKQEYFDAAERIFSCLQVDKLQ